MKKTLIFPLVLLVALASCRKDDVSIIAPVVPVGTIAGTVDNIPFSFNSECVADTFYHSYSGHILIIDGWEGEVANSNFISFSISHPDGPFVPGLYTPSSFYYWEQSDSTSYIFSGSEPQPQVVVTAVTDSTVEGTFSGTVYNNYGVNFTSSHTINNGKFNVKF